MYHTFHVLSLQAWSIVYHSWLTFVLLLWANVLWMIPNQRKAMMRSSPFIVLYAELLLVAQYIYGMDLNNNELPTKVSVSPPSPIKKVPCKYQLTSLMLFLIVRLLASIFSKSASNDPSRIICDPVYR